MGGTNSAPPDWVLLTDAQERGVVGAARGLKSTGRYNVAAAGGRFPAATHWSRDCDQRLRLPDPGRNVVGFVKALETVVRRGRYAVLIPGGEAAMVAISAHRHLFEPHTKLGLPPHHVVERSYEKARVLDDAAAALLAPPPSVVCLSHPEARAAASDMGFPVMIKPARSEVVDEPAGLQRHEASRMAWDGVALDHTLHRFGVPIIIQRYEQDPSVLSVAGVIAEGRLLAVATSRYHRTWQPWAGSASSSQTVSTPPELATKVQGFLARMGWQGIFEVELLAMGESRFALIDFNPRVYGSLSLAIEAGANLPAVWCDWLLGRSPIPILARPDIRYRWEEGEAYNLLWRIRHGKITEAGSVLRPQRGVVHALFRYRDPGPLIAGIFYAALTTLRRGRRSRLRPSA